MRSIGKLFRQLYDRHHESSGQSDTVPSTEPTVSSSADQAGMIVPDTRRGKGVGEKPAVPTSNGFGRAYEVFLQDANKEPTGKMPTHYNNRGRNSQARNINDLYAEDPSLQDAVYQSTGFHDKMVLVRNILTGDDVTAFYRTLKKISTFGTYRGRAYRDFLNLVESNTDMAIQFMRDVQQADPNHLEFSATLANYMK